LPSFIPTLFPTYTSDLPSLQPSELPSKSPSLLYESHSPSKSSDSSYPTVIQQPSSFPIRTLNTTITGDKITSGTLFKIAALKNITVKSFDVHTKDTGYKQISVEYVSNFDSIPGELQAMFVWKTLYDQQTECKGKGQYTPLEADDFENIDIPSNESGWFYVISDKILSTPSNKNANDIYVSNHDLQIFVGKEPFKRHSPQVWNGVVRYTIRSTEELTIQGDEVPLNSELETRNPSCIPTFLMSKEPTNNPSTSSTPTTFPYNLSNYALFHNETFQIYNATQMNIQNNDNDKLLLDRLNDKYDQCTTTSCQNQRLLSTKSSRKVLEVLAVASNTTNSHICKIGKFCEVTVATNISVKYATNTFSNETAYIKVLSDSVEFWDEYESMQNIMIMPTDVSTRIEMTLPDSTQTLMDAETNDIFSDVTMNFFLKQLSANKPNPIYTKSILIVDQVLNQKKYDSSTESQRRLSNSTLSDLEVTLDVVGMYLPPPEIDFSEVVVDIFEDEDTSFILINDLKGSSEFFSNLSSIKVEAMPHSENSGNNHLKVAIMSCVIWLWSVICFVVYRLISKRVVAGFINEKE